MMVGGRTTRDQRLDPVLNFGMRVLAAPENMLQRHVADVDHLGDVER